MKEVANRVKEAVNRTIDTAFYDDDLLRDDLKKVIEDLTKDEKTLESEREAEDKKGVEGLVGK